MKSCPNCLSPNENDARFCPNCGQPFSERLLCPNCGVSLAPHARFCPDCGVNLVVSETPPAKPQEKPGRRPRKRLIWLRLGLIPLAIFSLCINFVTCTIVIGAFLYTPVTSSDDPSELTAVGMVVFSKDGITITYLGVDSANDRRMNISIRNDTDTDIVVRSCGLLRINTHPVDDSFSCDVPAGSEKKASFVFSDYPDGDISSIRTAFECFDPSGAVLDRTSVLDIRTETYRSFSLFYASTATDCNRLVYNRNSVRIATTCIDTNRKRIVFHVENLGKEACSVSLSLLAINSFANQSDWSAPYDLSLEAGRDAYVIADYNTNCLTVNHIGQVKVTKWQIDVRSESGGVDDEKTADVDLT